MKATIESTSVFIEVASPAGAPRTQARLWTGKTESGIPIQLLILRVAVPLDAHHAEFERELRATPAPSPEVIAFPLRMVL